MAAGTPGCAKARGDSGYGLPAFGLCVVGRVPAPTRVCGDTPHLCAKAL